jgi:hypothetical protein
MIFSLLSFTLLIVTNVLFGRVPTFWIVDVLIPLVTLLLSSEVSFIFSSTHTPFPLSGQEGQMTTPFWPSVS